MSQTRCGIIKGMDFLDHPSPQIPSLDSFYQSTLWNALNFQVSCQTQLYTLSRNYPHPPL